MPSRSLRTCNNCGSMRDVNDTFCGTCGKPLGVPASEENSPTVTYQEMKQDHVTSVSDTTEPVNSPQPPHRIQSNVRYLILIGVLVTMLVGVGSFELGQFIKGSQQGTTSTTPSPSNQSGTVSPNASRQVGTILYQADWSQSLNGWVGSQDWRVLNGELLNDGTNA